MTKSKDWYPKKKKDSFKFNISVYNREMNLKETRYGVYNLSITLYPGESGLSGSQESLVTNNGEAEINDLFIDSSGTHLLKIYCESCETLSTEKFTVNFDPCKSGISVIICMCVISGFFLLLSMCFCCIDISDRRSESYDDCGEFIALFHPIACIFLTRPKYHRRARACLHLLSSGLFLLLMIGLMYNIFDTNELIEKNINYRFDTKQSNIGAAAWALKQAWIFPLLILNILSHELKFLICLNFFLEILTIISSIVGISILITQFCSGLIENWTYNFVIFFFIDTIVWKFIDVGICFLVYKVAKF